MIYLDYSATTPVNAEVLEAYQQVCKNYSGNPNSLHQLGIEANALMTKALNQTATLLNVDPTEIIYTSGATEANNLALKGVANYYKARGNHIITTKLEHASVQEPLKYLQKQGFKISYVKLLKNGLVDLNHLRSLITKETILVSICYVDSEIGLKQPITKIGELLTAYPQVIFHVDGTQAVGKIEIDLSQVALFSFSAHKFFGLKGIGGLIKKRTFALEPLLHGGKSNTIYRAGTPALPLIVSLAKALRLSLEGMVKDWENIRVLNQKLIKGLTKIEGITINHNQNCIPHIINISLNEVQPATLIRSLSEDKIYIATKSACTNPNLLSEPLLAFGRTEKEAATSIRISIAGITTVTEIEQFLKYFKKRYQELNFKKRET